MSFNKMQFLLMSETLDDVEGIRIATENRIRSILIEMGDDIKGKTGKELREHAENAGLGFYAAQLAAFDQVENQAIKELSKAVREHPLHTYIERMPGVGEKQGARLLATLGDPDWNTRDGRARRGPAELWAFTGYRPDQKKRKGERAAWNHRAKKCTYLVAASTIKQRCDACNAAAKDRGTGEWAPPPPNCTCAADGFRYRVVYDEARAHYADAVHDEPCPQCGPKGKPALEGSPLNQGHKHMRGIRKVSKEILKDLWVEAQKARGDDV